MKRRRFLKSSVIVAAAAALPAAAQQSTRFQPAQDIRPLVEELTKGAPIEEGGIDVTLPQLAENGNSVPLLVKVDHPMAPADFVAAIHVIAERNPRPLVASFHLKPESGRAQVSTRIRLAGTQKVTVLAEMSDRHFRMTQTEVVVTSAACLDESM
ncbi:MAG TPA: thiosulfate oxidation carrier protein SoxY [Usitatibacter sp.]|nr:thiosulfate oxidation carrier protein SoxY [Usitatibacter sp.]